MRKFVGVGIVGLALLFGSVNKAHAVMNDGAWFHQDFGKGDGYVNIPVYPKFVAPVFPGHGPLPIGGKGLCGFPIEHGCGPVDPPAAVPVPASSAMATVGLLGVALAGWLKSRKTKLA